MLCVGIFIAIGTLCLYNNVFNHCKWFQYVLGYFESENKYSVLPVNWLKKTKKGTFNCYWPNKRVTAMTIMQGAMPSSKWSIHPFKLLEQFGKLCNFNLFKLPICIVLGTQL